MFIEKNKTYTALALSEVKEHLKIDDSDTSFDSELNRVIKSSILSTEKLIAGDIATSTCTLTDYCVYSNWYRIEEPSISITSISATTSTGDVSTISGYTIYKYSSYTLIKFDTSVNAETLVINYTSGMATIPEDLKSALLIKIGMLFDIEKSGYVGNSIRETQAYNRIISSYMNLA